MLKILIKIKFWDYVKTDPRLSIKIYDYNLYHDFLLWIRREHFILPQYFPLSSAPINYNNNNKKTYNTYIVFKYCPPIEEVGPLVVAHNWCRACILHLTSSRGHINKDAAIPVRAPAPAWCHRFISSSLPHPVRAL